MPTPLRLLLLAAVVSSACAGPSAQRRLPPGAIPLRFAWPEHYTALVSFSYSMGTVESPTRVHRTSWWQLQPGSKEGQWRLVARQAEEASSSMKGLMEPEATVLIDSQGGFQGIEQPEHFPARDMVSLLPLGPRQQAELLERLDTSVREFAHRTWENHVGRWRDTFIIPGEPVLLEAEMSVPGGTEEGERLVEAQERITVESEVPCHAQEQERRCVRLLCEVKPLREALEAADRSHVNASIRYELVTDPQTLVPYSSRLLRTDEVSPRAGEEGEVYRTMMFEEYTSLYGAEPTPPGTLPL